MFEEFKPNIDYISTYFKTINDLYILNITSYRSLKITNLKGTSPFFFIKPQNCITMMEYLSRQCRINGRANIIGQSVNLLFTLI